MKIDRATQTGALTDVAQPAEKTGTSSRSAKGVSASVQLTADNQLQQLRAGLDQAPAFDVNRIAQIKQAIQSGQFAVNPEAIADGLIDSVRELLQTRG